MDYILGVDLGTSYFKLGLFNRNGDLAGLGRVATPVDIGDGTRREMRIDRFWTILQQGLQQACKMANTTPDRIQAVAYAAQANSFVLLDKSMDPLTPVILWSDDRSLGMAGIPDFFQIKNFINVTGLGVACNHQFCAAKILWLQKHQPEVWRRAAHLMTLSDYFTFALTNLQVGDAGTASLLGLLNIHNLQWQRDIIDLEQVELSAPKRPGTLLGGLDRRSAALLGLSPGIPFILGSLDHHMAAIGAGLNLIADMSESTGTVLACLKASHDFHPVENVCTGAGLKGGHYFQLAFDDNGAAGLEWYQQHYANGLSMAELEQEAAKVAIGSDGMTARPLAHRYKNLDGFENKSWRHDHGHFIRALLESTAAGLKKLVQRLSGAKWPTRITATGGGAKNDLWLQIKADLLATEFIRTATPAPACLGAAMLAAQAIGWVDDLESATEKWIKIEKTFTPSLKNHEIYLRWSESRSA